MLPLDSKIEAVLFPFNIFFLAALQGMWNFLDQESNLCPLQWKRGILTIGPLGKSTVLFKS